MYDSFDHMKYDTKKIVKSLMPNLIHSVDASIMRLIINRVYDNEKYVINHLHDSIQFNCNYYDNVIEALLSTYLSNDLKDILNRCLFNKLESHILPEYRDEFNDMLYYFEKKYYKEVNINKDNINIKGMYPFE